MPDAAQWSQRLTNQSHALVVTYCFDIDTRLCRYPADRQDIITHDRISVVEYGKYPDNYRR